MSIYYIFNRLTNCRYYCGNSSTAFLIDSLSAPSPDGDDKDASLKSPVFDIESSAPSSPPHVCLVDASKTEKCIYIVTEESSFSFNRTILLDNAVPVSDSNTQTCQFKQEEFSYNNDYYEDMICRTKGRCSVVCHASEEVRLQRCELFRTVQ